jgi:hypothetical protein
MRYLFCAGIIFMIGMSASCIKDPIHLDLFPIKANPGKFECFINGVDFVPDSNRLNLFGGPVTTFVQSSNNGTYSLIIEAYNNGYGLRDGQEVDMQIQNITGPGVYEFNDPIVQYAEYGDYPPLNTTGARQPQPSVYRDFMAGLGSLTITRFDLKNNVVAGTFRFNALGDSQVLDTVKITGGHFSISDYTLR